MNKQNFSKYDHVNKEIFEKIAENSKVLEIGCWIGTFGRELRKQKHCIVDGIDSSKEALKVAEKCGYRKLYQLDLNDLNNLKIDSGAYDYIVFGDVLEHVLYPEKVIQFFLKYLERDGKVMVSLPNIGFILYRLKLLLGRFDYEELGVMDKTHVKFYTFKTMKELFARVGLTVETVDLYNKVKPAYFILQILKNISPTLFTLQFVFMLRPLIKKEYGSDKEEEEKTAVLVG